MAISKADMITANASSDALIRRLEARAMRLGLQYTEQASRDRKLTRVDWRSADSLWPNFTRG